MLEDLAGGKDGLAWSDVEVAPLHVVVRVVALAAARLLAVCTERAVAEATPEREAVGEVDECHAALGAVERQQFLGLNAGTCIAVEGGQKVATQVGEYGSYT